MQTLPETDDLVVKTWVPFPVFPFKGHAMWPWFHRLTPLALGFPVGKAWVMMPPPSPEAQMQ